MHCDLPAIRMRFRDHALQLVRIAHEHAAARRIEESLTTAEVRAPTMPSAKYFSVIDCQWASRDGVRPRCAASARSSWFMKPSRIGNKVPRRSSFQTAASSSKPVVKPTAA